MDGRSDMTDGTSLFSRTLPLQRFVDLLDLYPIGDVYREPYHSIYDEHDEQEQQT